MFGNEADGDHENIIDTSFAKLGDDVAGERLQPFHGANLTLKRQPVRISAAEPIHDQLDGFFRLIEIRVTFPNVPFGNAVSAEKNVRLARIREIRKLMLDRLCK